MAPLTPLGEVLRLRQAPVKRDLGPPGPEGGGVDSRVPPPSDPPPLHPPLRYRRYPY